MINPNLTDMEILCNHPDLLTIPICRGLWSTDGYAHYPVFQVEERELLLRGVIADGLRGPQADQAVIGHISDEGCIDGLLWAQRFHWGETCFQIGMVHLRVFLVDPMAASMDEATHQALFTAFLEWCRKHRFRHVACRIPIQNRATTDFLEKHGFQPMDRVVCYLVFHRTAKMLAKFRSIFHVRAFEPEDASPLYDLIRSRFSVSRFALDARLPTQGKEAFFQSWTRRFYSGDLADQVLVAVDRNRSVVGFMGYQTNDAINRHLRRRVVSGGLGAAAPHAKGAYPALLKASIVHGARSFEFAELETQSNDTEVISIWERLGCLKVRESRTYHYWIIPD